MHMHIYVYIDICISISSTYCMTERVALCWCVCRFMSISVNGTGSLQSVITYSIVNTQLNTLVVPDSNLDSNVRESGGTIS